MKKSISKDLSIVRRADISSRRKKPSLKKQEPQALQTWQNEPIKEVDPKEAGINLSRMHKRLADPDADPMGTSVAGLAIAVYPQNKPQS